MPFAKRSTYTLTLAISTIIAAHYAHAETPPDQDVAWSCSLDKNGEWVCDVNEELVKEVEAAEAADAENIAKEGTEPATEAVSVEPAPAAVPAPPSAPIAAPSRQQNQPASDPQTPAARSTPTQPSSEVTQQGNAYDCQAGPNGEWLCDEDNTTPATVAAPAAPATVRQEPTVADSTAAKDNVPYQTSEVIGSEWQCGIGSSGDWDCRKINIHGMVLAEQSKPSGAPLPLAPAYTQSNPYAHLDWVAYQNPQGQQCLGHYLEPNFPIMGDEELDNPPMFLEAGRTTTVIGGLTQLEGGVNIRQGYRRLASDSAELDQVTNKARLEGAVTLREPGLLLRGDSAQVDTLTSEAIFSNAEYVFHADNLRGSADRIIRLEDERLRLEQGHYTYCPPHSNAWGLDADSIVLNQAEGFGTAEDAVLRVGGVPVFYAPYFTFPIDDTRRSGFLYPSIGYSEDNGLDVSVPYYFNIAPNLDATLTTRVLSDRGLLLENELRYLNRWSNNTLNTAFLPDDDETNEDRWLLGIEHQGRLSERWTSSIDFTAVSDRDYFDDLDTSLQIARQDHLDQRADLTYTSDVGQFNARVHDFETIDNDSASPYQRLPQFTWTSEHSLSDASNAALRAEFTRFDRDLDNLTGSDRITGDRIHVQPTINYEWRTPGYYIKPELTLWSTSYELDNQLTGLDDNPSVNAPIVSLDSGLFFDRERGNGGLQTLEPRVFVLYVPEEDQDDIPDFDTSEFDFSYSQLFRKNRFSGYDRIGDAQQVSLGVSTAFLTEQGEETARFSLGQAFFFADREVTLVSNAPDETENQSDIAAEALWNITPNWRFNLDAVLDHSDFDSNETNARLRYQSDLNHRFSLGYRFEDNVRDQTDLSFIWPIAQNWTALGRWLYDRMDSESLETTLGLEYEDCCWKVSFAGVRRVDDTNDFDTGILLTFTLKGLGSFGSGNSSFLNDIIGYEEREEREEQNAN